MIQAQNLFNLHDRTAIITGGAGLLGEQFCLTLASAGANVVVVDKNGVGAERIANSLAKDGSKALAIETDVTSPQSVQAMIAKTLQAFGKINILVNSAAMDPKFDPVPDNTPSSGEIIGQDTVGAFETFPLDSWNIALNVNLTGVFLVTQAAVKPMLENGGGVIVNLCSIYGLTGPDQRIYQRDRLNTAGKLFAYKPVYYTVTKAGILGFTRYLAAYYAGKPIRVNALTPGGVLHEQDEEFIQAYSARTVIGRMANRDEMNGALLYLVSDASSYMTGANLVVDGGWTAW